MIQIQKGLERVKLKQESLRNPLKVQRNALKYGSSICPCLKAVSVCMKHRLNRFSTKFELAQLELLQASLKYSSNFPMYHRHICDEFLSSKYHENPS
jgi:hypothetical protein